MVTTLLLPAGLALNRHCKAKYSSLLQAVGYTLVTDRTGRMRYVPPDGRLPGHGNPFAGGM
ncbi:hypothetical protein [Streptomyces thermoalcalitolerans]|uniref:DUF4224 domain-containing protein n=1 Tax=Streptomyces thermoalcalitolerans TaxID=65605 RepID=A0ABP3YUJ9_9ACTN